MKKQRAIKLSLHQTTLLEEALLHYINYQKETLKYLPDNLKIKTIYNIQDYQMIFDVIFEFGKIEIKED